MQPETNSTSIESSTETGTDATASPPKKKAWPWSLFARKKRESKKTLDHRNYPLW